MHLDKKTVTILVICTLTAGIIGGLVGAGIGGKRLQNNRDGQGMMMQGRGGSNGLQNGMYQRGVQQNTQPVDQQGGPSGSVNVTN